MSYTLLGLLLTSAPCVFEAHAGAPTSCERFFETADHGASGVVATYRRLITEVEVTLSEADLQALLQDPFTLPDRGPSHRKHVAIALYRLEKMAVTLSKSDFLELHAGIRKVLEEELHARALPRAERDRAIEQRATFSPPPPGIVFDAKPKHFRHAFPGAHPNEVLIVDDTAPTKVRVWDLETQKLVRTHDFSQIMGRNQYEAIREVAAIGDTVIVSSDLSGPVYGIPVDPETSAVYIRAGRQKQMLLEEQPDAVSSLIASHDGRFVTAHFDNGPLLVWDTKTHQRVLHIQKDQVPFLMEITAAEPLSDGTTFRIATKSGTVRDYDLRTQERVGDPRNVAIVANSSRLSADGNTLYILTYSADLRVVDLETGTERLIHMRGRPVGEEPRLATSPDGRYAAFAWLDSIWLTGVAGDQVFMRLESKVGSNRLTFSTDGRYLVISGPNGIQKWNLAEIF